MYRQVIELCIVKIGALKAINIIYNNIRQNGIVYIRNKSITFNTENNIKSRGLH